MLALYLNSGQVMKEMQFGDCATSLAPFTQPLKKAMIASLLFLGV